MTVGSPLPHRRAALIYAVSVIASYGALAAFFGVAKLMQVPLLAPAAIVIWWVLLAGPVMLLAALALGAGHAAAGSFFWLMVGCSVPITLLPVYFIARPSTRYTRGQAVTCQAVWTALGWIGYLLLYLKDPWSPP